MLAASAEPKHDRQRVAAVRRVHAEAHRRYRGGRIAGDALFLRSDESASLPDKDWHLRWSEVIDGTVTVELISGTHAALLESPNAAAMAKALNAALASLDGRRIDRRRRRADPLTHALVACAGQHDSRAPASARRLR